MKYLITNIKYSIDQSDIDDYLEERDNPNLWGISYTEADYEQARKEIQESLPIHLIVEPDEDNDDLEEALNNEISNATGWCIETYQAEELVNVITTKLNNFMEQAYEFWETEFGCNFDEIVDKDGGGGSIQNGDEKFYYGSEDNVTEVKIPLEDIINKIVEAGRDIDGLRKIIFWIYEVSE